MKYLNNHPLTQMFSIILIYKINVMCCTLVLIIANSENTYRTLNSLTTTKSIK